MAGQKSQLVFLLYIIGLHTIMHFFIFLEDTNSRRVEKSKRRLNLKKTDRNETKYIWNASQFGSKYAENHRKA